MEKLVCCIMGQDCEKFIGMCLESVKSADKIIYCDGGSKDKTIEIVKKHNTEIITNRYDQEDKKMNGKQRNFYLRYLKKNYKDYWCLCIDADEVVEDLDRIKEFIQLANKGIYSVRMRHLIQDLSHEDATTPIHVVPNRLFKINEAEKYPEVEHPVLQGNVIGNTDCTTIWHLAYIPNLWEIKKRYENHLKKSQMHTPEYLKNWYQAHLFGGYPTKQFNPLELPKIILNEFKINKDELYFANRNLEAKHFIMAKQWIDYFKIDNVLEFGCGKAPFGYAFESYGINYEGIELSKYAVKNAFVLIEQGNILKECGKRGELVLALDVLEHLDYKDLDKAINNLIDCSARYILVSIPFLGDPNLNADPTHKIKETKKWWIKQFTKNKLKLIKTPENFLFKEQILIFELQ